MSSSTSFFPTLFSPKCKMSSILSTDPPPNVFSHWMEMLIETYWGEYFNANATCPRFNNKFVIYLKDLMGIEIYNFDLVVKSVESDDFMVVQHSHVLECCLIGAFEQKYSCPIDMEQEGHIVLILLFLLLSEQDHRIVEGRNAEVDSLELPHQFNCLLGIRKQQVPICLHLLESIQINQGSNICLKGSQR